MKQTVIILMLFLSALAAADDGMFYLTKQSEIEIVINIANLGRFKYKSSDLPEDACLEFRNGSPVFGNFELKIPSTSIKSRLKVANDSFHETIKSYEFPVNTVSFLSYNKNGECTCNIEIAGVIKYGAHFTMEIITDETF